LPYAAIPPPTKSIRGELHEALEIKTPYTKWFSRMCEYGFAENSDFILVRQNCQTNNPKNPTTTIDDHQLTIDMAKELCMIQRSEVGRKCRQYFIEVEKQWNSPEKEAA
jgi:anti-repressor protein